MDRIWELNKKKDIVCLILSYPPLNLVSKERHKGWIMDVLAVTHKVRELKVSSKEKEVNLPELVSDITRLLYHSFHDIEAYLPHDMIEKMREETTESRMPKKEVLNLTIDFAIRQILEYIEIPELRRIGISGIDDTRLVSRLKNLPSIRNMFDVIILVSASNYKTIEEIEDSIARELGTNLWDLKNIQKIVSTSRFPGVHHMEVDLDIRLKDHLLSWELFYRNVKEEHSSSIGIQLQAIHVLKQCCGHLLATVLMARALKGVNNVRIWEYSSHALQLLPPSQTEDRILFNALAFIWGLLGSADQKCVKYCASYLEREGTDNVDLIGRWIKGSLIGSIDQGDEIIRNLVNALLLESFQNGNSVRMRDEIFKELVKLFKTEMNPMLLELGGMELREAPVEEAWKEAGSCELFMELPPEVGGLSHLEVLDLEGTEIINLPASVGKLTNLRCLKVSFYGYNDHSRKNHKPETVIPKNVIANLLQLKELIIDVNPDDERWNVTVKDIVKEVCSLDQLDSLKLYLPEVVLLNGLRNGSSSTKLSLMHYRFIVGSHMKRIICRLPPEIAGKFEEEERCLKYVNGEGVPTEIKEEHLEGAPSGRSLLSLKSLMLYTCPQLATVFTLNLLENLCHLEELVVEDCPKINSLVTSEDLSDLPLCLDYLPKLKKISLHYLPKLVSISSGLRIAPNLEWMSFYGCPSLRTLSPYECRLDNLKVIIGEADWWSALSWKKSEWLRIPNLDSIFVPIERDKDWMTQLAELNDQLKAWMQETKPSQPSGSGTKLKAEASTWGTLRTPNGYFELNECGKIKP
ncbi:hypothetical protein CK203_046378 [Vitis vinifera]|uniref:Disease resistance protein n=1 Tax=Vitis vinifera TaxID=29760 RepID=A0A438FW84_VITVI|nr:hypothetical protein CK203_046378 [Vitis vinifera]